MDRTATLTRSKDAYSHPQPHACFILSVNDDLVNEGGIMDLWVREARIFKYGSGAGSNFSNIRGRGESLSGGGTSSGLMSWLKIGDRAAGAIKSGGTTRHAAKMVILDLDHPDIETFINWKVEEEKKVAALIAAVYPSDYEGEAYQTVSGQNSNNSVRVPHKFMEALKRDGSWNLTWRTDGSVCKTMKAKDLWDRIAFAAWACADPGVQYDGTINDWHTCAESGRINGSNPCSEYMFLDNTACNLAALNLSHFFDVASQTFLVDDFRTVSGSSLLRSKSASSWRSSKRNCGDSRDYLTLGLGIRISVGPYDRRHSVRIRRSLCLYRISDRYAHRRIVSHERGDGEVSRAVREVCREPREHAPRHAQSPPRGLQCAKRRV